jgi:outer membrane murein-binding lipoprotein Lpp
VGLWDLYQHTQIRGVERAQRAAEFGSEIRDARLESRIEDLEAQVERLSSLVEAMWEASKGALGVTDDQLVVALDAVAERRKQVLAPVRCVQCDAAIGAELDKCQFCGAASPRPRDAFRGA